MIFPSHLFFTICPICYFQSYKETHNRVKIQFWVWEKRIPKQLSVGNAVLVVLYTWVASEKKLENIYNWLNGPPKGFWLNRSKENNRNLDFCCSHRWMLFENITLGIMLTRLFLGSNTSRLLSLAFLIVRLPLFLHRPNFQFPESLPFSNEMCSQLTSWKEEWEAFFCS